jgi:hypothetical protein
MLCEIWSGGGGGGGDDDGVGGKKILYAMPGKFLYMFGLG